MGVCAPIYHARWRIATKSAGALCGESLECVPVSRFLANAIQMNFAENQKRPMSAAWRGRPTQVLAGSMRAGGPTGSGSNSSTATAPALQVSYLIDNHYAIPPAGSKKFSLAGGLVVGVDFHETGCSGFTAYWNCSEAAWAHASCRRRMGSVDDWPLASPETEHRGVITLDGRRNG